MHAQSRAPEYQLRNTKPVLTRLKLHFPELPSWLEILCSSLTPGRKMASPSSEDGSSSPPVPPGSDREALAAVQRMMNVTVQTALGPITAELHSLTERLDSHTSGSSRAEGEPHAGGRGQSSRTKVSSTHAQGLGGLAGSTASPGASLGLLTAGTTPTTPSGSGALPSSCICIPGMATFGTGLQSPLLGPLQTVIWSQQMGQNLGDLPVSCLGNPPGQPHGEPACYPPASWRSGGELLFHTSAPKNCHQDLEWGVRRLELPTPFLPGGPRTHHCRYAAGPHQGHEADHFNPTMGGLFQCIHQRGGHPAATADQRPLGLLLTGCQGS